MDFDAFSRRIIELLEVDYPTPVSPAVDLYEEIGLDSLQALQLLIMIETLADRDVPPPEIPEIYTMQDAYAYYESLRTS